MTAFKLSTCSFFLLLLQQTFVHAAASDDGLEESDEVSLIGLTATVKSRKGQAKQPAPAQVKERKSTCSSILEDGASCEPVDGDQFHINFPKGEDLREVPSAIEESLSTTTQQKDAKAINPPVDAIPHSDSKTTDSFPSSLMFESLACIAVLGALHICRKNKGGCQVVEKNAKETAASAVQAFDEMKPSAVDAWGCTALHDAAKGGSAADVRKLCERGFKVDAIDAWDETPLHLAAREGHIAVCAELLAQGAAINAINAQDWTPLVAAADAGQEEMCIYLMDRKAGVHHLPEEEQPELLRFLLQQKVQLAANHEY